MPSSSVPEFVCAMEDVLEVYHRQFEDNEVLVCLDETSKQQVKETRSPLAPRPGTAMAYDYEYERNGVSNLFMLFAPLEGWRRVEVTDQRTKAGTKVGTKVDWARVVRQLVDVDYPDKDRIVLVMDNLNTHRLSSPVPGLRACRGETHCRETGNPLHAQARQLAEHGRDRTGSAGAPVSGPPDTGPADIESGNPGMGGTNATATQSGRTGVSPPRTHASSSSPSIPQSNTDGLLASLSKPESTRTEC